ncbi:MAG: V-type ATP synthase subunit B [Clostridia bacterium]|nr:V-type ATP synthase subunit B [Clostridia bacterium]
MKVQYIGLEEINGPLVFIKTPKNIVFEEQVVIELKNGEKRIGDVIRLDKDITTIQVYESTTGMNSKDIKTEFMGTPLMIDLSKQMLGRVFNGTSKPIDGLGEIKPDVRRDINSKPINPIAREYPKNYIQTGISSIDVLMTLIRGQKLPIFSGSGMNHNELTEKIIRQANINDSGDFAVVFGLMGAEYETAEYFKKSFEENGVLSKVVMFQNLSSDSAIERILTPKIALTCAEYLAFDLDMQVLVVLTDMTAYAESLREISTLKGEIPSRKGYPGYLYSDLASIYERAGQIKGRKGTITQIPILTMPNDDISHPIPDITGYITEGQIVLSRELYQKGISPPINILDSLSRLMKDGVGEGFTRDNHIKIADQIFTSYSKVQEVRALAKVLGESDLSFVDKKYLEFGKAFEEKFINQDLYETRTIYASLDLALELLKILPEEELNKL